AAFAFPIMGRISAGFLPTSVSNLFLFLSQFIFPYDMLVVSGTFPLAKVFQPITALALNFFNWVGIGVLFAWYFQKTKKFNLLLVWAAITVFLVTITMQIIFGILGLELLLETP
nr:hypothetical protein [Deltaproteobacteria bacterium]